MDHLHTYLYPFFILFGLVLILLFLGWIARRWGGHSLGLIKPGKDIQLKEMKALDPKTKIVVILWKNNEYLIAVQENNLLMMDKTPV